MNKLLAILRRMEPADYVFDLLAFAGTVTLALLLRWQAHDVIWSLWISSLTFGYAWLLAALTCSVIYAPGGKKIVAGISGLFLAFFFTVHFGTFHLGHGAFLNEFFPLWPGQGRLEDHLADMIPTAFAAYWPFVLMTFVSRARDFPWRAAPQDLKLLMFTPYLNIIRMHILIFVFAFLQAAQLTHYALFPVLLFYFFPWRIFNLHRKALLAETTRLPENC